MHGDDVMFIELKEVKMSYKIETHDYEVRLKNAKKFITQGNRVRELRECPDFCQKCTRNFCDFIENSF